MVVRDKLGVLVALSVDVLVTEGVRVRLVVRVVVRVSVALGVGVLVTEAVSVAVCVSVCACAVHRSTKTSESALGGIPPRR